jgi:hypothetical protein
VRVPRRREVIENSVLERHRACGVQSRAGTHPGKNGIAVYIEEEGFETLVDWGADSFAVRRNPTLASFITFGDKVEMKFVVNTCGRR